MSPAASRPVQPDRDTIEHRLRASVLAPDAWWPNEPLSPQRPETTGSRPDDRGPNSAEQGTSNLVGPETPLWVSAVADRLPARLIHARWSVSRATLIALLTIAVGVGLSLVIRAATAPNDVMLVATDQHQTASTATPNATPSNVSQPSAPSSAQPSNADSLASWKVHVVGHVHNPGVYDVRSGQRVVDAITLAGGPSPQADLTAVNLARAVVDGEQIYVPKPGENIPPVAQPNQQAPNGPPSGGQNATVNINTATESQLTELPGVGPVLAGRIVQWRHDNGNFISVDELGEVSGIGPKVLESLRDRVST